MPGTPKGQSQAPLRNGISGISTLDDLALDYLGVAHAMQGRTSALALASLMLVRALPTSPEALVYSHQNLVE